MAYQPASNLTSTGSITHLVQIYYRRKALSVLKKRWVFRDAAMEDMIPRQNGKTIQWFRYNYSSMLPVTAGSGSAPSTQAEGQVGTGLTMTSATVQATLSQYADFLSISDLLKETALDPIVENAVDQLSYRAGFVVDQITRLEVDAAGASAGGGSGAADLSLLGSFYRAADAANANHLLRGLDVQPMQSGKFAGFFMGVIHPYVSYDLVNDPSAGNYTDIFKELGNIKNFQEVPQDGMVATIRGVKFIESTNVRTYNSSGNKWRVYVFGEEGLGVASLESQVPTKVSDPYRERFKITVIGGEPDKADPEGVIGAMASYKFTYVAKTLDTSPYRWRTTDAPSSIVA